MEKQIWHFCGMSWIERHGSYWHRKYQMQGTLTARLQCSKRQSKTRMKKLPEQILTDSWKSYKQGISKTFADKPQHVAKCGIAKPNNNNRMERLNGTIRERTKVVRAWKKHKTPLAEGQRIHYNFVKPHQALEGQTPALAAGIEIKKRNKWLDLLGNSMG